MAYPADTFETAVDLSITASNQLHTILNGDSTTEVIIEDGSKIPSVRKAYTDSLFFLPPQSWAVGEYETTYNQLRAFVEPTGITTWWFSKNATVSTPILMSTTPHQDHNWTLWNTINNSVYETQRRLAAEAGLNMVGSFLLGAAVTATEDVVFYETDGNYYAWEGTLPKTVLSGSTPATTGGIGIGTWYSKVDLTLRDTLTSLSGAALITTSENISVQSKLNNIDIELPLKADKIQIDSRIGTGGTFSFRNKLYDGALNFWYEATSQTSSGYGSDTMSLNSHSGSTKTHSRQALVAGVDLPAIDVPTAKYFSRTVVSSVVGASNFVVKRFRIEDISTFAGKTTTFSLYGRADASKNISVSALQNFGTGGSPSAAINGISAQLVQLTTSFSRKQINITFPSISGKTVGTNNDSYIELTVVFDAGAETVSSNGYASGMVQQSGTFDIACVQLEEGTVATPFEELSMEITEKLVSRYFKSIDLYGSWPISSVLTSSTQSTQVPLQSGCMRAIPVVIYPSITLSNFSVRNISSGPKVYAIAVSIVVSGSNNSESSVDASYLLNFTVSGYTWAAGDYMRVSSSQRVNFDARL